MVVFSIISLFMWWNWPTDLTFTLSVVCLSWCQVWAAIHMTSSLIFMMSVARLEINAYLLDVGTKVERKACSQEIASGLMFLEELDVNVIIVRCLAILQGLECIFNFFQGECIGHWCWLWSGLEEFAYVIVNWAIVNKTIAQLFVNKNKIIAQYYSQK